MRLVEIGKGFGLALLAFSMIEALTFTQAQFRRIIIKHLGLAGDVSVLYAHHCGNGAKRVITEVTVNNLEECPMLWRGIATHIRSSTNWRTW